jgi:hypothetical protein
MIPEQDETPQVSADRATSAVKRGLLGFNINERKAEAFGTGDGAWSTTTLDTVGLAVKNALLIPEKTANKYLYIASFTITSNEVIAALEKAMSQKFEVTYVDPEEQKKIGFEKLSKGDQTGLYSLLRYLNLVEGHGANFATYRETSNELLSLPKENLDAAILDLISS